MKKLLLVLAVAGVVGLVAYLVFGRGSRPANEDDIVDLTDRSDAPSKVEARTAAEA